MISNPTAFPSTGTITIPNTGSISASTTLTMLSKDSFGNEVNLIIKETRNGGSHPNIFNNYNTNITTTLGTTIPINPVTALTTVVLTNGSAFPSTGDLFITNDDGSGYEVFTYTSKSGNNFTGSYKFQKAHTSGVTVIQYGSVIDYTLNPDVNNEAL